MNLTPVESSHIAAIGYLEEDRVLLVRYNDGALYAVPNVGPFVWRDFEVAYSKGRWLKETVFVKGPILISSPPDVAVEKPIQPATPPPITADEMRKVADSKQADCSFGVVRGR